MGVLENKILPDGTQYNAGQEAMLSGLFQKHFGGKQGLHGDTKNRMNTTVDKTNHVVEKGHCARCGSPTGKWGRCTNSACSNSY